MSAYMQRQADLWQRRAWKAEDNLRCLLQELDPAQHKAFVALDSNKDIMECYTNVQSALIEIAEIIEHYKGEMK